MMCIFESELGIICVLILVLVIMRYGVDAFVVLADDGVLLSRW